jgi:Zn-dependent protease
LTLNPLAHLDWVGTVILPLAAVMTGLPLFGWAKPVPVNPRNLRHPRKDMFWIAFAGPLSNMILACIGAGIAFLLVRFTPDSLSEPAGSVNVILRMLVMFISVNVFLAIFNMIPLHPLDGAKVIARFLPESLNNRLEDAQNFTSIILIMLFASGAFSVLAGPARFIAINLMRLAGL